MPLPFLLLLLLWSSSLGQAGSCPTAGLPTSSLGAGVWFHRYFPAKIQGSRLQGAFFGCLWAVNKRCRNQVNSASSKGQKSMLVSFLGDLFGLVYPFFIAQGHIFLHVWLYTVKSALMLACNFFPWFFCGIDDSHCCWKSRIFTFFFSFATFSVN